MDRGLDFSFHRFSHVLDRLRNKQCACFQYGYSVMHANELMSVQSILNLY